MLLSLFFMLEAGMEKTNLVENKIDFRCLIVRKKLERRKKKPCLTGFLRIAYTSSTKNDKRQGDQYENEPSRLSEILSLDNPAFYERAISCSAPSKDESNLDVRHARYLWPGLLLAVFKENFNGRHLAFYLDSCVGLCLV